MLCQNTREWKAEPALPMFGAMSFASLPHVSFHLINGKDGMRGSHFSQHLQFLNPDTANSDANLVKCKSASTLNPSDNILLWDFS